MSTLKLARVHWHMGQTLLPEHLIAQEEAQRAALQLRIQSLGVPVFGIAQLTVNEPMLRDGVFAVTSLSAVLWDGLLVDVPALCQVAPLSLSATGASRAHVFLHILDELPGHEDNPIYAEDARVVRRLCFQAQLAVADSLDRSRGLLKLAEVEKGVDGTWTLDPGYIPPLLQVGTVPFLSAELAQLGQGLASLESHLEQQLQDTFLRPERLAVMRRTLAGIYGMQSLLGDLRARLWPHPYHLFQSLRELFFELCCFHEILPEDRRAVYRHEELGTCFGRLLHQLLPLLKPVYAHSTHVPFAKGNGLFTISVLPDDAKLAQEVYLLIQRPHVHQRVAMDDVKLSCTSRLALVHRMILKGVTYQQVAQPAFRHPFGPEVDFYQLAFGEEWNFCIKESSVSFYIHPELARVNAFLFWR